VLSPERPIGAAPARCSPTQWRRRRAARTLLDSFGIVRAAQTSDIDNRPRRVAEWHFRGLDPAADDVREPYERDEGYNAGSRK